MAILSQNYPGGKGAPITLEELRKITENLSG
jgi:hypothetical protein